MGAIPGERAVPTLRRRPRTPKQEGRGGAATGRAQARGAGRPTGGTGGGAVAINLIILVLVAVAVIIAAGLLAKTVNTASSIDEKATSIRDTGTGINTSTDSIMQLVQTNKIARSILRTARPLQPSLAKIVQRAQSINSSVGSIDALAGTILSTAGTINNTATTINGTAGAINSVAGTINGTAGAINEVAGGINSVAGAINSTAKDIRRTTAPGPGILGVARLIDRDASNIVQGRAFGGGLAATVGVASTIKSDTGNILENAKSALDTAACIDRALNLADKGDCANRQP